MPRRTNRPAKPKLPPTQVQCKAIGVPLPKEADLKTSLTSTQVSSAFHGQLACPVNGFRHRTVDGDSSDLGFRTVGTMGLVHILQQSLNLDSIPLRRKGLSNFLLPAFQSAYARCPKQTSILGSV